jgi:hypothetical protein
MIDIESWLWRHFGDLRPYGSPQSDWRVDCPFCGQRGHGDDVKGHLHVSIHKEACHCFRCDYSASWVRLVMDCTGLDYYHALGELYVKPNPGQFEDLPELLLRPKKFAQEATLPQPYTLPADFIPLWQGDGGEHKPILDMLRAYMQQRRFPASSWERYNLGYVPTVGPRVYIPVEGDYWQARSIFHWMKPKYIGPAVDNGNVLSNWVSLQLYDEIVITEGVFSGMAVGPNHVALVGKNATPGKVRRLVQAPVSHYIITVEPEAVREMMRLADELTGAGKRVTLWQYEHGDPADSKPSGIRAYDFEAKLRMLLTGT